VEVEKCRPKFSLTSLVVQSLGSPFQAQSREMWHSVRGSGVKWTEVDAMPSAVIGDCHMQCLSLVFSCIHITRTRPLVSIY
jgi:hypothetical protein